MNCPIWLQSKRKSHSIDILNPIFLTSFPVSTNDFISLMDDPAMLGSLKVTGRERHKAVLEVLCLNYLF